MLTQLLGLGRYSVTVITEERLLTYVQSSMWNQEQCAPLDNIHHLLTGAISMTSGI